MKPIDQAVWPPVVAVVSCAAATVVCIQGWPHLGGVDGQTWAAWVQGVGSIGAILGAFALARVEYERESKLRRETAIVEARSRLLAVAQLGQAIEDIVERVDGFFYANAERDDVLGSMDYIYSDHQFETLIHMVAIIPVHEFPYAKIALEILNVLRDAELLRAEISIAKDRLLNGVGVRKAYERGAFPVRRKQVLDSIAQLQGMVDMFCGRST